jgi:hypothetical protein
VADSPAGRLLDRLGASPKVRFARLRAAFWALLGLASVPLGWANSVALVWAASVYANVASEVAAAEAADDHAVLDRLDKIEAKLDRLLLTRVDEGVSEHGEDTAREQAERGDSDESVGLGGVGLA